MSLLALISALALSGTPMPIDQDDVTQLSDIVVIAGKPTWLLTVVVEGETDETSLVTGAVEIRCGPNRYRYEAFGRPRLCWARRERGETVTLVGQSRGRPGRIDWTGCTSVSPEGVCTIGLGSDTTVTARFLSAG